MFSVCLTFAQTTPLEKQINIHINVLDTLGAKIENASITIFDSDKNLIKYGTSNSQGYFNATINYLKDSLQIEVRHLGFEPKELLIENQTIKEKRNIDFEVVLLPSVERLNEVIIEENSKVTIKQDTVVFNVQKFQKNSDNVIEDVLSNLPGILVDKKGNISVNGKEISKITIDGKDIFNTDYKIPSKNIDASDVKEVELINNFSENPVLKSFLTSEDIALNLVFKKNRRNKIYAKTGIGLGVPKKYDLDATIFNLGSGLNFFLINNINNVNLSSETLIPKRKIFTKLEASSSLLYLNRLKTHGSISEEYFTENSSQFNSASIFQEIGNSQNLRLRLNRGADNLSQSTRTIENFTFTENTNNIDYYVFQNADIYDGELFYSYKPNDKFYFSVEGNIDSRSRENNYDVLLNSFTRQERFTERNTEFYININSTIRLSENKALDSRLIYIKEENPQDFSIEPNPFTLSNYENFRQAYNNPMKSFGLISSLLGKHGAWNFGVITQKQELNSDIKNIENLNQYNTSNRITNSKNEAYLNKKLNFLIFSDIEVSIYGELSFMEIDYRTDTINKKKRFVSFQPAIGFTKLFEEFGKLRWGYALNSKFPNIIDLYTNPILTNSTTFSIGSGVIEKQISHKFSFTHSKSDFRKQLFYTSSFSYDIISNGYGYEYLQNDLITLQAKTVIPKTSQLAAAIKFDKILSQMKSSFSFKISYLNRKTSISLQERARENLYYEQIAPKLVYATLFNPIFNLKFSGQIQYNRINQSSYSRENTQYYTSLNLESEFSKRISIKVNTDQLYMKNLKSQTRLYNLISLEAKYIIKKNKMDILLKTHNLTNEKGMIEIQITDISNIENESKLTPFYTYLKLNYRF